MNGIWGLSESQFVTAYSVALASAIAWARTLREQTAPTGGRSGEPALTTDELAYLAGGRRRAVETSIARLLDSGALRVSRAGRLEVTGRSARNHLDMAVLAEVGSGEHATLSAVVTSLSRQEMVRSIGGRLVKLGLLVDQATLRARLRHAVFPILVLGTVGLLYWVEAVVEDQPIGWLTLALALTAVAAAITTRPMSATRTLLGERTLAGAARRRPIGAAADHGQLGVSWSAAKSVAVGGFRAYPDAIVRDMLLDHPVATGQSQQTAPDPS